MRRASSLKRLLILYFLIFILVNIYATARRGYLFPFIIALSPLSIDHPYQSLLIMLLTTGIMLRFVDRRSWKSMGVHFDRLALCLLPLGFLVGTIAVRSVLMAFFYVHNDISLWQLWLPGSFQIHANYFLPSLYEELFFRGYLFQTLYEGVGMVPTVLLTSSFFGLGHYNQAGWLFVLGAGILGLALSIAYLKTRSLWLPIGLHLGWDMMGSGSLPSSYSFSLTSQFFYYIISMAIFLVVLFLLLPLRPHPKMQAIWDQYIHPAPWPPWKRVQQESEVLLVEPFTESPDPKVVQLEEPGKPAPPPKDQ